MSRAVFYVFLGLALVFFVGGAVTSVQAQERVEVNEVEPVAIQQQQDETPTVEATEEGTVEPEGTPTVEATEEGTVEPEVTVTDTDQVTDTVEMTETTTVTDTTEVTETMETTEEVAEPAVTSTPDPGQAQPGALPATGGELANGTMLALLFVGAGVLCLGVSLMILKRLGNF